MIVQLWNTNTSAFVSCDADLTENYMYISMKFGTGVHVFCWEVGVFNRSSFQSVSCKYLIRVLGVSSNFPPQRQRCLIKLASALTDIKGDNSAALSEMIS